MGRFDAEHRARGRGGAPHLCHRSTRERIVERTKRLSLPSGEILLRTVELQPQRVRALGDKLPAVTIAKLQRRHRGKRTNRCDETVNHVSVMLRYPATLVERGRRNPQSQQPTIHATPRTIIAGRRSQAPPQTGISPARRASSTRRVMKRRM